MNKTLLSIQNMAIQTTKLETDIHDIIIKIVIIFLPGHTYYGLYVSTHCLIKSGHIG